NVCVVCEGGGFRTRRGRGPGYPLKRSSKGIYRNRSKPSLSPTRAPKSPHRTVRRGFYLGSYCLAAEKIKTRSGI
ncbi:hypothetical protein TorRG33x02_043300, partial [Trema orientale]